MKYNRFANKDHLEVAAEVGFVGKAEPIIMQFYSSTAKKFRLGGKACTTDRTPKNQTDRDRLVKYFDPLPLWYPARWNNSA